MLDERELCLYAIPSLLQLVPELLPFDQLGRWPIVKYLMPPWREELTREFTWADSTARDELAVCYR